MVECAAGGGAGFWGGGKGAVAPNPGPETGGGPRHPPGCPFEELGDPAAEGAWPDPLEPQGGG